MAHHVASHPPHQEKRERRDEEADHLRGFECNICLDVAQHPVVTPCGHLYCWTCLYRWMQARPNACPCPVCKAHVLEKQVRMRGDAMRWKRWKDDEADAKGRRQLVPLYGRGQHEVDPREQEALRHVPNRPTGRRTAVSQRHGANHERTPFGIPHGTRVFGILLGHTAPGNAHEHVQGETGNVHAEQTRQIVLSRALLLVGLLVLAGLLLM